MISLIVCSTSEEMYGSLQQNVAETIGVEHEIIRIDNRDTSHSICSAYNKGASVAKFPLLCFVHEDVILHTEGWGKKIGDIFSQHNDLGLLGVAGSMYKSFVPWGWSLIPQESVLNILQEHKYRQLPERKLFNNPANKVLSEVVCIDGVWMCTRKAIVDEMPFDEELLTGFHCYDIDFSLNVFTRYKVAVTFDVLLTHLSEGNDDRDWVLETIKTHRKWKNVLPLAVNKNTFDEWSEYENTAINELLFHMTKLGFTTREMLSILGYNYRNKQIGKLKLLRLTLRVLRQWVYTTLPPKRLFNS